jgi:hypothetical protein
MSTATPSLAAPDLERAVWTTAYINNLPDACFAYIEPGGKKDASGKTTPRSLRHLPYKDASGKVDKAHTRNALARLPQTNIPDAAKAAARRKLIAAAKSVGIEVSDEEERAMSVPTTGKIVNFFCPIRHRDEETWEIEGVMSDEQVDTFKTGFDYESMKRAVESWWGNIREQHDPRKAVGKRVYVLCDDANKQVILRARISKGAPDTWAKIMDGTLTGFSIGAWNVQNVEYRTINNQRIPYFKDFELAEVSVVDRPSNPGAAASGLTIYRAAGVGNAMDPFYGSETFDCYPDEIQPAPVAAAAAAAAADAASATAVQAPAVAAPAVASAAVAPPAVDPAQAETLRRALAGEQPQPVPGEDPRAATLHGAQAAQALMQGRQAQQMALASGALPGGGVPFVQVPLSPITEDELLPEAAAGDAAARTVVPQAASGSGASSAALEMLQGQAPGSYVPRHARGGTATLPDGLPQVALPDMSEAALPSASAGASVSPPITRAASSLVSAGTGALSTPTVQSAGASPAQISRAYYGDASTPDPIEQAMNKEKGTAHTHDHAHAGGYAPMHTNDHEHQHADGTVHAHPHYHNHDHHDHYGDPGHAHPHTHTHEHPHEYRLAAPDLSRVTEPQPAGTSAYLQSRGLPALPGSLAQRTPQPVVARQEVSVATQERGITTATGLVGYDLATPAQVVVPGGTDAASGLPCGCCSKCTGPACGCCAACKPTQEATEQRAAAHGAFTGKHAHPHSAMGSQGDDQTHDHEHEHKNDALHDHAHPEADESGDEEGDENTSRVAVAQMSGVVTPETTRIGKRVSASMQQSLHTIRDTVMSECNCPECQDLLAAKDMDDEEEGEEGADDADSEDTERAARAARRLQRLAVAQLTRSVRRELEGPLQASIAQLRAIVSRYTAVAVPDLKRMETELTETRSALAEVLKLVGQIAEADQKYGPLTRAADPRLVPVEKVLSTSPQAILDASAPGGGLGKAVTPEMIQAELAQYQRAIASGQLSRQEDQVAAAAKLVRQINGF